ncbi:hypothetical protein [Isoptericola aurantiacus]|uniref:hypothetical protein n=1 Tax=Isoptericola aurantiacus TaxID=3377839 RepID=UPI00383AF749
MAALSIVYSGGAYELVIPNSGGAVVKIVDALDNPAYGVENLAAAMQDGAEQVVADSQYIFGDDVSLDFVQTIFASADSLELGSATIFAVENLGETLLEFLAEAGEALAAALA